MSTEIETEVVVGTAKSCECVARNDVIVENDLEFGIEWNVDSGSNSSENLEASILPPVDESADNCDESTDSSSVFDDEPVGSMLIAILMRKVRVTGQSLRVDMLVVMLPARFLKGKQC